MELTFIKNYINLIGTENIQYKIKCLEGKKNVCFYSSNKILKCFPESQDEEIIAFLDGFFSAIELSNP